MRFTICLLALAVVSFSAQAAEKFPTWKEFRVMTKEQMKALPDVKVPADKPLTADMIANKSIVEVVLMKNSIFAQKGFDFTAPHLKNYFRSRSWYNRGNYQPANLTKVDRDNAKMLNGVMMKAAGKTMNSRQVASKKNNMHKKHRQPVQNYGYGEEGDSGDYGYGYGYGEEY